jgi:hypothetical protein
MPVAALVFLVEAIVMGHWYLVPLVGLCGLGTPRFPSWTLLLAAALYWVLGLHAAAVVLALNFPVDLAVAGSEQGLGRETLRLDAPAHDARRPAAPAPAALATSDVEAALRDVLGSSGSDPARAAAGGEIAVATAPLGDRVDVSHGEGTGPVVHAVRPRPAGP